MILNESLVENAALEWFGELGYACLGAEALAPAAHGERASYGEVILVGRLRAALRRLNPTMPEEAREEALRKVLRIATPSLTQTNRAFHRLLRDGVPVEYTRPDGSIAGDHARLVDFREVAANDWLVVNQFRVVEGQHHRRPDIVIFINGLPLGLIELKNPVDEDATLWSAYAQLQTYKAEIPSLLHYNGLLVVSDGVQARMGSVTASQEWFKVWRTIDGRQDAAPYSLELEVLIKGVFARQRFLDLLQHFIVFEEDPDSGALHKIIAGYHQFHAVNAAVEETVRASGLAENSLMHDEAGTYWAGRMPGGRPGDRRAGVVWHTQGSGKSFSMVFFAGRLVRHPAMRNPTLVVLTDRNDLDDQLFGQFLRCADILGQIPVQAAGREDLRTLLNRASGGVIFTTIHKFMPEKGAAMPELSARQNIVVIADEAHRSQYGFAGRVNEKTGEMSYGLASNLRDALPNASFIGFTGTPIEKTDANTRGVFGDYISVYDIQRAVADQATVPIYYESRIAKLALNAAEMPLLDAEFEEITEGEEQTRKEQLKSKWAALEALVGDPKRIALIAADLVAHFERRLEAMDGKAMIVCMSRRICVDMYDALIRLRPDWASAWDDDPDAEQGRACVVKVVMTGSADDGPDWQPHIRSKDRRRKLANRFKDSKDPFRIVIVRDMWLTGFDAPCLHTLYADKPMQGHGLMQAIARVNRVFRDKPGGLVVDYLGLADQLKEALATYTESGGQGNPTFDTAQAIAVMLEKHGIAAT
jgi:type I restriction enzyme R subunit